MNMGDVDVNFFLSIKKLTCEDCAVKISSQLINSFYTKLAFQKDTSEKPNSSGFS